MVRLAARRLVLLLWERIGTGDGRASKWCFDVVSNADALARGGQDCDGDGIRNDKFLRLRARRFGESERV